MTQSITPDRLKNMATALRKVETNRLGASLPHTTILNTLTQSLGLGEDFRAYKASFVKDDVKVETSEFNLSSIKVVFGATEGEWPTSSECYEVLKAFFRNRGWQVDPAEGAHGFAILHAWKEDKDTTEDHCQLIFEKAMQHIDTLKAESGLIAPLYAFNYHEPILASPVPVDHPVEILIDFQYNYNKRQICTATASKAGYTAALKAGMSSEAALLALYYDIEIGTDYVPNEVTVLDVRDVTAYALRPQ